MNTKTPSPSEFLSDEKKRSMLEHMNDDHSDAVLRYAKHFARRAGSTAAKLIDIDRNGIDLLVTENETTSTLRIDFEKPLATADEAHTTLVRMARVARMSEAKEHAAESAQWFRREFKTVVLGTVSNDGVPDASVAPAAWVDADGAFYTIVSSLSNHTGNMLTTGRASVLLIEDESASAQLLARRRLTFPCSASLIPRDTDAFGPPMQALKDKFGSIMGNLEKMSDFQILRLSALPGRLAVGFGQAYDVDPRDWTHLTHVGGIGHGNAHGGHHQSGHGGGAK